METITMFEVTLVYADETTWFVGGFPTMDLANDWINEEKTRPYWVSTTQIQIEEK
jgi:hypothetical protein